MTECCAKYSPGKFPHANLLNQNKTTIVDVDNLALRGTLKITRDNITIIAEPVELRAVLVQCSKIRGTCGGVRCVLTIGFDGRSRFEDVVDKATEIAPGVYRLLFHYLHPLPHELGNEKAWCDFIELKGSVVHLISGRGIDVDFIPGVDRTGADNEGPKRAIEETKLDDMTLSELVDEASVDELGTFLDSDTVGISRGDLTKKVRLYNETIPDKTFHASISKPATAIKIFILNVLARDLDTQKKYSVTLREIIRSRPGPTSSKREKKTDDRPEYEKALSNATIAQIRAYLTSKKITFLVRDTKSETIARMNIQTEQDKQEFVDFINNIPAPQKKSIIDDDADIIDDEPAPAYIPAPIRAPTPKIVTIAEPEKEEEEEKEEEKEEEEEEIQFKAPPIEPPLAFGSLPNLSQPMGEWTKIDETPATLSIPLIISKHTDGQVGVDEENGIIDIWNRENAAVYLNKAELWQNKMSSSYRLTLLFTPRDDGVYSRGVLSKIAWVAGNSINIIFESGNDSRAEQAEKFVRDAKSPNPGILPVLTLLEDYSVIVLPGRNLYPITRN